MNDEDLRWGSPTEMKRWPIAECRVRAILQ
jgi:hypothetical protein